MHTGTANPSESDVPWSMISAQPVETGRRVTVDHERKQRASQLAGER